MPESTVYLLRIMEGTRCVAEAPLIVHDKEAAQRCWLEGFPQVAHGITGAIFQMLMLACGNVEPPAPVVGIVIRGMASGLQIVRQMPSGNGHEGVE